MFPPAMYEGFKFIHIFAKTYYPLLANNHPSGFPHGSAGNAGGRGDTTLIPGWEDPIPVLSEKSHGQRSLTGYSPWGHTESDMTE